MLLMLLRFFAHTQETEAELAHLPRVTLRLMTTVLRPLGEVLTQMPVDSRALPGRTAGPGFGYNRDVHLLPHKRSAWVFFGERLWELATMATRLRADPTVPVQLQEDTAALQDLACQFAAAERPPGVAARVAVLQAVEAGLGCYIQASLNGPYLVTNATNLQKLRRLGHQAILPDVRFVALVTGPFDDRRTGRGRGGTPGRRARGRSARD
jgi:hypothetical protein